MSKDPAFLFYPNDYIGGTMGMTFEEKGAYMELLMLQFNRGHMTSHMIGQVVGQLWVKIEGKFVIDDNGLYYNKRLDEEINKRKTFIESRFNNLSGRNQYNIKRGHKGGHMTNHMENENENENKDINRNGKTIFLKPELSEVKLYCEERKNNVDAVKWFNFYEAKGWMIGKNKMKDWKAAVRTWENGETVRATEAITYKEMIYRFNQGEVDIQDRYEPVTPGDKRTLWKLKKQIV
jgi:uncharacterized protein YdaU (DUF1376 family)